MSEGNSTTRWGQARQALAAIDTLVERHARLADEAPALGRAAQQAADQAFEQLEQLSAALSAWVIELDEWGAAHERQGEQQAARTAALVERLRAAWADAPADLDGWVQAALDGAPVQASLGVPDAVAETTPPPADVPAPDVDQAPTPDVAIPAGSAPDLVKAVADPQSVAAQFNFSLHDMEPIAIPADDPPLFDFDDAPANDDLSTLQPQNLDEVIQATPEPEIEDVSMGSIGLMDTSALSTEQVRAQLRRIRAERAAAESAQDVDEAPAAGDQPADEPVVDEPIADEPIAADELVIADELVVADELVADEPSQAAPEPVDEVPAPAEVPAIEAEASVEVSIDMSFEAELPLPTAPDPLPTAPDPLPDAPDPLPTAPDLLTETPAQDTPSLVQAAVVEVESGPLPVLDVRELLGEPPERPSRLDAAIRAALSDAPEPAPPSATTSADDWLEVTPTSHPPRSALESLPSVSVELDGSMEELDSTVALQAQDLSAAMEAVADADDWLDVSQSLAGSQSLQGSASMQGDPLTSNQSLAAIAADDLDQADPWDELDISAHGEVKANPDSMARPPRVPLNINVGIEHGGTFFTARSDNISSAGMFVTCHQDLPVAGRVDLFFEMPEGQSVAVQAQVSRENDSEQAGYGLQFLGLRYDDRVVIDRFVTAQVARG